MDNKEIICKQINEMQRHKWIESEKAGYDLGDTALLDWVEAHAEPFTKSNSKVIAKKEALSQ
jgi:hypothetical protein